MKHAPKGAPAVAERNGNISPIVSLIVLPAEFRHDLIADERRFQIMGIKDRIKQHFSSEEKKGCAKCNKKIETAHKILEIGCKTVVGLGIGATAAVGTIAATAAAGVAVPAIILVETCALTGAAVGGLLGIKNSSKKS